MKKILSIVLVAVMLFSVMSITAFAEDTRFKKNFVSNDEMKAYIAQYAEDYPNSEFGEIVKPIKNYTLKQKELVLVAVDSTEYTMTDIFCGEKYTDLGINFSYATFEKNNGEVTVTVETFYGDNAYMANSYMEDIMTWVTPHEYCCNSGKVYIGEIDGYQYIGHQCLSSYKTTIGIAVDDVYVHMNFNTAPDEEFLSNMKIEISDVLLPVFEYDTKATITVTDEVLEAARKEYNDDSITKDDITVTDYNEFDGKKIVRFTVAGYEYADDKFVQRIGIYVLTATERPVPQILSDGVLYDIYDAYDIGVISDYDLEIFAKHYSKYYKLTKYGHDEILGDADADRSLTVMDATCIQRYLCRYELVTFKKNRADFDKDGFISVMDATGVQRKLSER